MGELVLHVEMNQEINVRNPGGSKRAKMLLKMCEPKEGGDDDDPTNEQKIIDRQVVWQELWIQNLQRLILVLTQPLRRMEQWSLCVQFVGFLIVS